jgi:hypothetical protein
LAWANATWNTPRLKAATEIRMSTMRFIAEFLSEADRRRVPYDMSLEGQTQRRGIASMSLYDPTLS